MVKLLRAIPNGLSALNVVQSASVICMVGEHLYAPQARRCTRRRSACLDVCFVCSICHLSRSLTHTCTAIMELGQSLEGTRALHSDEKARELKAEEGDDCTLVIQLPNGDQQTHKFKLGTTVAYVKLQIEQLYSLPMTKQKLTCGGRTLIDPLSLCDCPGISADGSSLVMVEELEQ